MCAIVVKMQSGAQSPLLLCEAGSVAEWALLDLGRDDVLG